ncbi:TonB-dependent receptor plug domain-containing protein [Pontibacter sp. G13]|uniref:TonB-dependent receptor n=1 Tax=Pontibacter sp. G13 TaxID=3074898 RepID=UPI002889F2A3|nr:TonB-dependent receptor plug domain-containing protein [Pontibacter sp. G13]WNJ16850.1 TonB-dependent receptor plug domain-containing protein [Pontibacter sp. G13]
MNSIRTILGLGLWLFSFSIPIQAQFTLSGTLRAVETGETLIGATIAIPELGLGTYTNDFGFYSLSVPVAADSVEVKIAYTGYLTVSRMWLPESDQIWDIELQVASLDEVVIEAESYQEQLKSTQMSVERVTIEEAKALPALFGEVDIIKTLQLKPGVSAGSEGSSGIFVRGGGSDQNLVLLDNTVVYNPSHLFGFFSTFNSDAVKDVKLYKGGFPAKYGGRLSSVIDVKMKEGNRKKFSGAGGLGLISSRLTLEGPIVKEKASFLISGRRTYVDLITRQINRANEDNDDFNPIPDYFFWDGNAKVNWQINDRNSLYLGGYLGKDAFNFTDLGFDFNFNWGNANATLRWNYIMNPNLFLNVSASFADYEYMITNKFDIFSFELSSRITDQALRADFTWQPNNRHTIRFGGSGIRHDFDVGRLDAGSEDGSFDVESGQRFVGTEIGAYLSDDIEVSEKVQANVGLRFSGFANDSTFYAGAEPRASLRFLATDRLSLKASYAMMFQYLHLVANSGATLPTDVWYPSNATVKPQRSQQLAGGINYALGEKYLMSIEGYYKWLDNQIDFRNGAELFVNPNLDEEFVFGEGWAYGTELYFEKKKGRWKGWIGYTLAWSWRQFDGTFRTGEFEVSDAINNGEAFPATSDKRHDITVVSIFEVNKRITVSGSWEYRSGTPTTLAPGYFFQLGQEFGSVGSIPLQVPDFGFRNDFRLPAYHRMDLGVVFKFFPKWGTSDITVSAYNAYNRRNPYFIYIDTVDDDNGVPIRNVAQQVALFPIIPSVTWNFAF